MIRILQDDLSASCEYWKSLPEVCFTGGKKRLAGTNLHFQFKSLMIFGQSSQGPRLNGELHELFT